MKVVDQVFDTHPHAGGGFFHARTTLGSGLSEPTDQPVEMKTEPRNPPKVALADFAYTSVTEKRNESPHSWVERYIRKPLVLWLLLGHIDGNENEKLTILTQQSSSFSAWFWYQLGSLKANREFPTEYLRFADGAFIKTEGLPGVFAAAKRDTLKCASFLTLNLSCFDGTASVRHGVFSDSLRTVIGP